jgi:hypothetical protein
MAFSGRELRGDRLIRVLKAESTLGVRTNRTGDAGKASANRRSSSSRSQLSERLSHNFVTESGEFDEIDSGDVDGDAMKSNDDLKPH